jgi:glyoxylase-like metal-dependent hydrolase (beta-lactamase superfamily II)
MLILNKEAISMNLRIFPIKVGNELWSKSYLNGPGAGDTPIDIPHIIFYIDGADKKVLVDTGGGDPASADMIKFHSKTYTRKPEEEPTIALKMATGVSSEEIDIVILTHLHWDHACNCHLFPNAEFYVQMTEVIDSINPVPRFAKTYQSFNIGTVPPWAQQPLKWNFLYGDTEILPGIKVLLIPGHSAGIQGVAVTTNDGLYFLGSDAYPLYDNINEDGSVLPSMLSLNLEAAFHSSWKVSKLGAKIIPGHDIAVLDHKFYPVA